MPSTYVFSTVTAWGHSEFMNKHGECSGIHIVTVLEHPWSPFEGTHNSLASAHVPVLY